MVSCSVCVQKVTAKQPKVSCSDCDKSFHGACVKMTKADIDTLATENLAWRCEPCKKSRRQSMRLETQADQGTLTLADVMNAMDEIRKGQKNMEKEFNKTIDDLSSKLQDNTSALVIHTERIEAYMKCVEELKAENNRLKEKNAELEKRIEDAESYSRRNCVEICGVPETPNEKIADVIDVVKKVGIAVDMEITESMIDTCHRLGRRQGTAEPRGIIVKFVRRLDKDSLLAKKREKRQLSTRHMDLHSDRPVYINESLTSAQRKLFAMARQVKKEKSYKFVWHRGGRIFAKKEENGTVIAINNQSDLSKM